MKKRILIPVAIIGGIAVYLASQFPSFNFGDIGIPSGTEMISVDGGASPSDAYDSSEAKNNSGLQTVVKVPSEEVPERLLLVDVVIDGEQFNVKRVTDAIDSLPKDIRQPATVDEIIAMVSDAEGDKSGTRVRVSRTSEAVASAEARLMEALQNASVSQDEVERRSRLVE